MRRGGAVSLFEDFEDVQLVMWEARWQDQRTLTHYLQTGIADFVEAGLGPLVREAVLGLAGRLKGLIACCLGL